VKVAIVLARPPKTHRLQIYPFPQTSAGFKIWPDDGNDQLVGETHVVLAHRLSGTAPRPQEESTSGRGSLPADDARWVGGASAELV